MSGCVHDFRCQYGKATCRTCGGDAVAILTAALTNLEAGARSALGFLVNGQREDAERTLRTALAETFPVTTGARPQLQLTITESKS